MLLPMFGAGLLRARPDLDGVADDAEERSAAKVAPLLAAPYRARMSP
jgi:hypothetical protein